MKAIKTQAVITSLRSKVDKSIGLTVNTPELSSSEKADFMDLQGHNVDMLIKPVDSEPEAITTVKSEVNAKTPRQKQRNVIWRIWEKEGKPGDYQVYYGWFMEKERQRLIDKYLGDHD